MTRRLVFGVPFPPHAISGPYSLRPQSTVQCIWNPGGVLFKLDGKGASVILLSAGRFNKPHIGCIIVACAWDVYTREDNQQRLVVSSVTRLVHFWLLLVGTVKGQSIWKKSTHNWRTQDLHQGCHQQHHHTRIDKYIYESPQTCSQVCWSGRRTLSAPTVKVSNHIQNITFHFMCWLCLIIMFIFWCIMKVRATPWTVFFCSLSLPLYRFHVLLSCLVSFCIPSSTFSVLPL